MHLGFSRGPGENKGPLGSDSRKFAKFGTDVVHTVLNHFKMGAKIGAPFSWEKSLPYHCHKILAMIHQRVALQQSIKVGLKSEIHDHLQAIRPTLIDCFN